MNVFRTQIFPACTYNKKKITIVTTPASNKYLINFTTVALVEYYYMFNAR